MTDEGQLSEGSGQIPPPPQAAVDLWGDRLGLAQAYVDLLAGSGVSHGLIGPREVPRLWDRHVLNCAVVQELIPAGASVVDVGSGAGLPGIPLAITRPDLQVTLVEPLLRRTRWLTATIESLDLTQVTVRRGKAEAFAGELQAPVVTARAVSRLSNLGSWCSPLLQDGGQLMALKGESAPEELRQDWAELCSLGFVDAEVRQVGIDVLSQPTTVVVLTYDAHQSRQPRPGQRRQGSSSSTARVPAAGRDRRRGRMRPQR
ncbi:Ribosomal RNA small subunit methyltransferase G [Austwickia sp. TVS 96-490-7B]|uniref:16S rRNA (guanine(527)-N(7))-methyltransferase RsmG n=1 Tax=Austwickia sp. TVS 96-490-7B TaxID=2830843 RepID=UPI001C58A594|nr:16S rRNA (guanine(527)-N(7))-methyltransferase RsmG [Austwickia sp. TVS 96-490-7B]MBW3084167.1 Ribosomal RNA small subunit methyltransferase G [Austwickia sp. TVS 96-490-7B]